MDYKELKRLVELVENAGISHLSIDENGSKIEIKKELASQTSVVVPQAPTVAAPQITAAPADNSASEAPASDPNVIEIKAQMVGTYYQSSSPDSPAFVNVGDKVKKGSVLCVIEAMKLFNEIESEHSGTIEKVCVSNEQAIEFGQTLFLLRKG